MSEQVFKQDGREIGIKRLYVDGQVDVVCPRCNTGFVHDLSEQYLSYPCSGVDEEFDVYCEKCDDHVNVGDIRADLAITVTLCGGKNEES